MHLVKPDELLVDTDQLKIVEDINISIFIMDKKKMNKIIRPSKDYIIKVLKEHESHREGKSIQIVGRIFAHSHPLKNV